jgi:Predicted transcriptional regulators
MYSRYEELLKDKGITSYRVAKETGISQVTLSDWKSGKSSPKLDKLKMLAEYFEVDVSYFII